MKLPTPEQYDRRVIFAIFAIPLGFITFVALLSYDIYRNFFQ